MVLRGGQWKSLLEESSDLGGRLIGAVEKGGHLGFLMGVSRAQIDSAALLFIKRVVIMEQCWGAPLCAEPC